MDRPPAQRVEVVVSARTLLVLLAVGGIVALVLLSLGTLLSVFVAAVLALGLDPVVDREEYAELAALLVQRRPASLAALAAAEGADARRLHLRIRNLGVEDWAVWARQDAGRC